MPIPTIFPICVRLRCAQARYRVPRRCPARLLDIAREAAALAGLVGWVAVWIQAAALILPGG